MIMDYIYRKKTCVVNIKRSNCIQLDLNFMVVVEYIVNYKDFNYTCTSDFLFFFNSILCYSRMIIEWKSNHILMI